MLKQFTCALRALFVAAALLPLAAVPGKAHDTVTLTDVAGRTVTVPHGAERVLLGFYFEDFHAIVGPDAYDKVVAISRDAWEAWRNTQWKSYVAVNPNIEKLIDVREVDSGTFNVELAIAAKPDVAIIAGWQYRALGTTVETLENAGIPVVVVDYNAQTLEKHLARPGCR